MPIKNIIFDLGGVILNIDSTIMRQNFAKLGAKNVTLDDQLVNNFL